MYTRPSKRRKRAQLTFIYILMTLTVVGLVTVLVLAVQGYRFNRSDGKIEQGGLVQFDSQPSGADVQLDGIHLANKTASRITALSGQHTVTMSKEGYWPWLKDVTVVPGTVLWLDYARLLPTKLESASVVRTPAISSEVVSKDRKMMAYVGADTEPTLFTLALDNDKPTPTMITIPVTTYTMPAEGKSQSFRIEAWDRDNRYGMVRHTYDDGATEWIVVDLKGSDTAVNISKSVGFDITKAEFAYGDNHQAYVLTTAHEVRRVDLSAASTTGPLLSAIADFSQYDSNTVTFETLRDASGTRGVGYLTRGASKPRVVKQFTDDGSTSLKMRIGEYYGDRFVVINHRDATEVLTGDLPASDASTASAMTKIATIATTGGVDFIGFSPAPKRFVYAQRGSSLWVYDLELRQSSTVILSSVARRQIDWLDGYHVASTDGGKFQFYDFDGTNGRLVASNVSDFPVCLSANQKYYYYVASDAAGAHVMRTKANKE